jgi:hypothetical protein
MEFNAQNFSKYLLIIFVYGTAAPGNFVWVYDGSSCKKCSQAMHNKGTVCSNGLQIKHRDLLHSPTSSVGNERVTGLSVRTHIRRTRPDGNWIVIGTISDAARFLVPGESYHNGRTYHKLRI